MRTRWHFASFFALACLTAWSSGRCAEQGPLPGMEMEFPLREVSALATRHVDYLDIEKRPGQEEFCSRKPDPEVKAYPKFKSSHPLFGKLTLADNPYAREPGVTFHFALDESRGTPPGWMGELFGGLSHNNQPASWYDRLYLDVNRDLDLTNDPVLATVKELPAGIVLSKSELPSSRVFEEVILQLDLGPPLRKRSVRLVPLLSISSSRSPDILEFLSPAARQGKIRVGREEYEVLLTQVDAITGGLDRPRARFYFTPTATLKKDNWWSGSQWLGAVRVLDGEFYQFTATPNGDRLTVRSCRDLGTLETRTGGKGEAKTLLRGSLLSREQAAVPVGISSYPPGEKESDRVQLPVGDYLPMRLSVCRGRAIARFEQRPTPGLKAAERWPDYFIRIRKDRPFVAVFSQKPVFVFLPQKKPAPDRSTFRRGDVLAVGAYLVDPTWGLVTGLWEKGPIEGRLEILDSSGNRLLLCEEVDWSHGIFAPLMPSPWSIPEDLKIAGKREILTVKISIDTLDLYGVIEGTTTISVEAD